MTQRAAASASRSECIRRITAKKYRWNKQHAAEELGLSRQGLIKKVEEGGMVEHFQPSSRYNIPSIVGYYKMVSAQYEP